MEDDNHLNKPVKLQPIREASFLSKLFFCWAPLLFIRSYGKTITEEYYTPLKSHTSERLGNKFESAWDVEAAKTKPSLWRVIWKIFRLEFTSLGLLFLFSEFILKMNQPWLIGKLMQAYTEFSKENCYFYGALLILSNFLSVIVNHFYMLQIQHLGMKIRIGCCSLIYRKSLKTINTTNTGNIINLLSNDVNRFDLAPMHLLQVLVAPLETAFVIYCLYATVGPTAIAGILLLLLFIPVQMFMGKLTMLCRRKTAEKTDKRIKLMDEILIGIQVIKMFTWEKLFAQMIKQTRKNEIRQIMKASFIRAFNVSSMLFLNRFGIFLCIISYVVTEKEIHAEYVFVVSSFYAILRQTLTVYFPFGIQNFSETRVSIQRLQSFLMSEEIKIPQKRELQSDEKTPLLRDIEKAKPVGIYLENVSMKWSQSSPDYVLQNVNLEVGGDDLVVITGAVGSGKSALLHAIVSELNICKGKLDVVGKVSYASQDPWLFSGTIRQNILFGSEFDQTKYKKILEICQLEKDIESLPVGDGSFVGERGSLLSGGQKTRINLARALYKDADIYLLDDPFAAVDATVGQKIFQECVLQYLKDKCRVLVTHSNYLIDTANKIYILENGELKQDCNHRRKDFVVNETNPKSTNEEKITDQQPICFKIEKTKSKNVFKKYTKAGGNPLTTGFLFLLFICTQTAASGADYFIAFWSNLNATNKDPNLFNLCTYIYTGIMIALIVLSNTRSILFFFYCMKASTNLHNQMFAKIIRAPMVFFKGTSTGQILNRFSKDLGLIDETLPSLLMDTFQVGFIVLGSVFLVSLVNPCMVLPTSAVFFLFYLMKIGFITRSRNMKRLESEARSPVYSHIHASLRGLTTIRIFNVQKLLKREFDHYQDLHSSAFYTFMTCNRAFGYWLDMICVFYIAIAITIVTLIDTPAGSVGLSVTQSINLIGVLQWGIRQWSESQNQMVNVERVVEYTTIPQETDSKERKPLQNCPNQGEIKFENVSLKYSNNKLSLKNLNFVIKPGEKVAVIGRTGAGKSSLISTLFRLYEIEGKISIDGVDIKNVSLERLRMKLSIIPQEPILFSGSLRKNIDPYSEFGDEEIWKVLEQVELKEKVSRLSSGLISEILQGGFNFSVGERQLICLARAILRKNKIVIMDEPTANVDLKTDYSIHQMIKKLLEDCTVITVAHRLNNIREFDKILVMDDGRIVEFGSPDQLMDDSKSLCFKLVKENENSLEKISV